MRACPACQREWPDDRETCPRCMATLVDDLDATITCPECGRVCPVMLGRPEPVRMREPKEGADAELEDLLGPIGKSIIEGFFI